MLVEEIIELKWLMHHEFSRRHQNEKKDINKKNAVCITCQGKSTKNEPLSNCFVFKGTFIVCAGSVAKQQCLPSLVVSDDVKT